MPHEVGLPMRGDRGSLVALGHYGTLGIVFHNVKMQGNEA
jgi:hypothetical protein